MPRISDAKKRLMDAATDLMWESSYGSTSVDAICDKAGVKKGSFYYFFESKSELAVEALETDWQSKKPELDAIFTVEIPPLERFERYFRRSYNKQCELHKKNGRVLGCALFTLGSEISTLEQAIRAKVEEILGHHVRYLSLTVKEAQIAGLIRSGDSLEKGRMIFACYHGTMIQARIQNDLSLLKNLPEQVFEMLGAEQRVSVS